MAEYRLTYSDEFNSFDSTRWLTCDFWGMRNNSGDYQGQWFCDPGFVPAGSDLRPFNPFTAKDGILTLRAQPTPPNTYAGAPPNPKGQDFVSGQMTSAHRFTQRYGYYELRAKLPPGKGLWARFWFLTDDGSWPGEYDVFEVLGKENPVTVHQTTHYRDALSKRGIDGKTYKGINPVDGKFHTYGFLWEPKKVTWFVDGVETLQQDNRVNIPMYALIDLAVGKDPGNLWPGNPDETTPWPADMELDYYRVYSNDPSLPTVTPGAGFTPSVLPQAVKLATTPSPAALPPDWSAGDIGSTQNKGSSTWNPTTTEWMLKSSAFGGQRHFAGKPLSGDGGIIATVLNTTAINSNDVNSGVMIREDSTINSREVSLLHTTSLHHPKLTRNLVFASRSETHGKVETLATLPDIQLPATLLLMRSSDTITAAYSPDGGTTWKIIGNTKFPSAPEKTVAGIAVIGNQNNYHRQSRSTFNNLTVGQAAPVLTSSAESVITGQPIAFRTGMISQMTGARIPTGPVKWSVVAGGGTIDSNGIYTAPALLGAGTATIRAEFDSHAVTRTIAIRLPDPWRLPSLVHTPPGDAGCVSDVWTLVGGGKGISIDNNHDTFRFLSSPMVGNHTLTVKVQTAGGTQAGLVIRDSTKLDDSLAGARGCYAGLWITPTGLQWATRESASGKAKLDAQTSAASTPSWLRITRTGESSDIFTAYHSTDGSTWNQLGNPRKVPISETAQVGLMLASGTVETTATATFSDLSVDPDGDAVLSK